MECKEVNGCALPKKNGTDCATPKKNGTACATPMKNGIGRHSGNNTKGKTKPQPITSSPLKEKTFIERESLLTEMFKLPHLKNIYHIGIVVFMTMVINSTAYAYIYNEHLTFGLDLLIKNFSSLHVIFYGWLCISFVNLFTFHALQVWAYVYNEVANNYILRKTWNFFAVICLFVYYWKSLKFAGDFVWDNNASFAGSFIILLETVRLLMKTHAFVRYNAEKVLNFESKKGSYPEMPTFKQYVSFLFYPTLIYRENYPRTEKTNWLLVAYYFVEVLSVIICVTFIFEHYFMPVCEQFRTSSYTIYDIIWAMLKNTLPSFCLMILMFYLFLHAWMNAFSEIMRFADRQFYQDWWNSTSFEVYYRKWNMIVHEWLYVYIYKDIHDFITPNKKFLPKLAVFLVSSIVHEYIIYYTLRMFYPALFILFFGFGGVLSFVRCPQKPVTQVLFLYGFALGLSIGLTAYLVEGCVRENNCVLLSDYVFSYYEPRTFSGNCLK